MMASIYTTIIISIERYIAVSKPLDSNMGSYEIVDGEWKNALLYTMPVALFSLGFSVPRYFEVLVTSNSCIIVSDTDTKKGKMTYYHT